jgi:hypothetical protein
MGSLPTLQLDSLATLHFGSLIGSLQLSSVAYLVAAMGVVAVMVVEICSKLRFYRTPSQAGP